MLNNQSATGIEVERRRWLDELLRQLEPLPPELRAAQVAEFRSSVGSDLKPEAWKWIVEQLHERFPDAPGLFTEPTTPKNLSESDFPSFSMESTVNTPASTNPLHRPIETLVGKFIGRYRIDEFLGRGGFGEVWKGFDPELNRPIAIKLGRRDRVFPEHILIKLLSEARRAASMSHSGIVQVYDITRTDDGYVIVSEWIDGESLSHRMKAGPVALEFAITTVMTIAQALHHAHVRDLIHRDVKPGNILLRSDGSAVLSDFGLAITERELVHEAGNVSGTIRYMSPEQARGDGLAIDHRSDIFSLGLVFYSLLAGRLPYPEADSISYLRTVATRAPRPLHSIIEHLPSELSAICMKCLAFAPEARFATCRELVTALEDWRKSHSTELMLSNSTVVIPPRPMWSKWASAAGMVSIVALLAAILIPRMKQYLPGPAVPQVVEQVAPLDGIDLSLVAPPTATIDAATFSQPESVPVIPLSDDWTPLLRQMPHLVSWPLGDGREAPRFAPAEQRLSVKSERTSWIFQCADIETQPMKLRMVIAIDHWEGHAGILWGLREIPEAFPEIEYHCLSIEFQRGGPREPAQLVARKIHLKRYSFDDVHTSRGFTFLTQDVPIPETSEIALDLEVRKNGVVARLGTGQPWEAVDNVSVTDWLPAGRGAIGITGQGQGVSVRSLSIRRLPGAVP